MPSRISRIDVSHRSVAWNRIDAEEVLDGWFVGPFLKGQQRRTEEPLRENRARENIAKAAISVLVIEYFVPLALRRSGTSWNLRRSPAMSASAERKRRGLGLLAA